MSYNSDAATGPRGGRRPRGICPKCCRLVALTAKTGLIGPHDSRAYPCPGRNQPPADAQSTADLMAELLAISANLHAYIEVRAQEIAAARLAELESTGSRERS